MAIGKINGVTISGGGGGGSASPVCMISRGGRIQQATNNYTRELVMSGTIGRSFYNWSGAVSTTNLAGLGTPGTSTLNFNGSVYTGIDGGAFVPIDGTVHIQGVLKDDSASTVAGTNIWYHVWKMSSTYVAGMASGTFNSSDTPTLVASAQTTTPSSLANITPVSFISTNGITVSQGDYLIATMATDAVVTATEYRVIGYEVYITP